MFLLRKLLINRTPVDCSIPQQNQTTRRGMLLLIPRSLSILVSGITNVAFLGLTVISITKDHGITAKSRERRREPWQRGSRGAAQIQDSRDSTANSSNNNSAPTQTPGLLKSRRHEKRQYKCKRAVATDKENHTVSSKIFFRS